MPQAHEWSALGTYAQLVVDDGADDRAALAVAQRLLEAIDATCSRFRPDSDLSRASAAAGTWVRVDPLLVRAVDTAIETARWTGGLVDPTLGRQLVDLGYDRDLELIRAAGAAKTAPAGDGVGEPSAGQRVRPGPTGGRWVEVATDATGWLRVPEGCALDLGATGKAFAADLVASAVARSVGGSAVVSLGGDVASVCQEGRTAWPVLVSDTAGPSMDVPGETLLLPTGGLATSSTRHRRWTHGGATVHHILDQRTGRPALTRIASASVRADTWVAANAASTAAVILGVDAPAWLRAHDVAALIVDHDGTSASYGGWTTAQAPRAREAARMDVPC